jgi:hypothetical protein
MKLLAFICAITLTAPASAETFDVSLGSKALGKLSYSKRGRNSTLTSTLDNTPLGVFNGTFKGSSAGSTQSSTFVGESKSSRKQRVVTVEIIKGKATSTTVTPIGEQTEQSDAAQVQSGVIDPIRAIARLINAEGCPVAMRMYDGRRVIALRPTSSEKSASALTCSMSYKVIAGPGHLSPLRISSAKMLLSYDVVGTQQSLDKIKISSGLFSLNLIRKN